MQWYFFGAVSLVVGILGFFIFRPFFSTLAIAALLAILFHPLYAALLKIRPGRDRLAAAITVMTAVVCLTLPLSFLLTRIVKESRNIYLQVKDADIGAAEGLIWSLEDRIRAVFPNFSFNIPEQAATAANWVVSHIGGFVFGTIETIFLALLGIFLFYYFLRNGEKIKDDIIILSPLPDIYDKQIITAARKTVDSVLRGSLLIALVQGTLAGIGLWIFGVPNPVIWGSVAAASALLPGIGTGLVLIPAIIYLAFINGIGMAIGLGIWGATIVGLVDNFLAPVLYGKHIHIHPVFVLLSILGGLGFFGIMGFIFGPMILSLIVVLRDIYRLAILGQEDSTQTRIRAKTSGT